MQQQLTQALEAYLQKLDDEARIEAINAFRQVLHHYSPFRSQPVDCVNGQVNQELVAPNDYNPNNIMAPPPREASAANVAGGRRLYPAGRLVIQQRPQAYTIVDGFHCHSRLACSKSRAEKNAKRLFAGDLPDE